MEGAADSGNAQANRPRRKALATTWLAAALLLGLFLLLSPPAFEAYYPRCPVHEYLGLLCPGCGSTRALAALLHGRLDQALKFNALFVLLLPAFLFHAITSYLRAVGPGKFHWPQPPVPAVFATVCAAVLFTILRNFS